MGYEERSKQPLHIKIEGLIGKLLSACNNDTLDTWILPECTIFNMEEVKGKQRPIGKKRKIVRIDPTDVDSIDAYDVKE